MFFVTPFPQRIFPSPLLFSFPLYTTLQLAVLIRSQSRLCQKLLSKIKKPLAVQLLTLSFVLFLHALRSS